MASTRARARTGAIVASAAAGVLGALAPSGSAGPAPCAAPHGDTLRLTLEAPGGERRSWAGWEAARGPLRWIARHDLDERATAALAWRGNVWREAETVQAVARSLARRHLGPAGRDCRILDGRRVVAHFGSPVDEELGILGIGTPQRAVLRLRRQAAAYAELGRPTVPALELVAVLATRGAGADGRYRSRLGMRAVGRYLAAAREADALLILDIQPGRSSFPAEARALAGLLRHPEVSLALDPEWHMGPGQVPGESIGSVDATQVNRVAALMSRVVRRHGLPPKLLLVHQFTPQMVRRRHLLQDRPGVDVVINVDGFGTRSAKRSKYRALTGSDAPGGWGIKLFFKEDVGLMSPRDVLGLRPRPDVIVYE